MNLLKPLSTAALATVFASPAWSIMLNGVDVGEGDIFLGATPTLEVEHVCKQPGKSSNPKIEECWSEYVLGDVDLIYDDSKTEGVSIDYVYDNGSLYGVFDLAFGGGYYIIKNSTFWALFENVSSFDWGVINVSLLPAGMNLGDGHTKISHVTEFLNEPPRVDVPEPGSLLLFGAALLGVPLLRRRRSRA